MDQASDEITLRVTETVADALNKPIEDLPPLTTVVDPDALAAILSPTPTSSPPSVTVAFRYAGVRVLIHRGAIVYAQPITGDWIDKLDAPSNEGG